MPLDVDGQSDSRQDVCNIYPESLTVDSQGQRWYRGLFAYQYSCHFSASDPAAVVAGEVCVYVTKLNLETEPHPVFIMYFCKLL